jgi:hypothetical protein
MLANMALLCAYYLCKQKGLIIYFSAGGIHLPVRRLYCMFGE